MEKYDVIIVGAGPCGIYGAYELIKKSNNLKILLVDKGKDIYHRTCPVLEGKIKQCPQDIYGNSGCYPSCSMTSGFGGCGAFSDGKFNITNEFGGWMDEYIPKEEVINLIKYVDEINLNHGAPKTLTDPNTKEVLAIEKTGLAVGLKLLRSQGFESYGDTLYRKLYGSVLVLCYSLDNDSTTNPDEKIKHYGLVDRSSISENSFTISGTAEVPATARIMGIGALRVYQDDSELADGTEYLKNFESFMYRTSGSGDFIEIKIADGNKVDADEIPMGFDGNVMVDLQGNFYRISGTEKNIITGIEANDLIYRANNIMMVYYDEVERLKLGYLYEEGIYVNDTAKTDDSGNPVPYIISITDDNDLLTACWIGKSGKKYLFATQENGFWIAELSDEKNDNNEYAGSIHQYNAENDGQLSDYLPSST